MGSENQNTWLYVSVPITFPLSFSLPSLDNFQVRKCHRPVTRRRSSATHHRLNNESWEVPLECITLGEELGSGAYGTIHKGVIDCCHQDEPIDVAVKLLKSENYVFSTIGILNVHLLLLVRVCIWKWAPLPHARDWYDEGYRIPQTRGVHAGMLYTRKDSCTGDGVHALWKSTDLLEKT